MSESFRRVACTASFVPSGDIRGSSTATPPILRSNCRFVPSTLTVKMSESPFGVPCANTTFDPSAVKLANRSESTPNCLAPVPSAFMMKIVLFSVNTILEWSGDHAGREPTPSFVTLVPSSFMV
jgi:hypothetical protein